MKKLVIFMALVVLALTMMGGLALAGGWTTIDYSATHDPDDTDTPGNGAYWNPDTAGSPHGNFSATSNRCRVCHAVHLANADSWRLLADNNSADPCAACHGYTGLTELRPYGVKSYVPKGEHTLSSSAQNIPDSTDTVQLTDGLGCGTCHSVHGGNTLDSEVAAAGEFSGKLLRMDPNGDTSKLGTGFAGVSGNGSDTASEAMTNFCADCHNNNPNWDDADGDPRPNPRGHVQGDAADGTMSINGVATRVANFEGGDTAETSQTTERGCRDCHAAVATGNSIDGTGTSAFPHQTKGSKLLFDSYDGDLQDATDNPNRVLESMDQFCGKCHSENGDFTGDGVGTTF